MKKLKKLIDHYSAIEAEDGVLTAPIIAYSSKNLSDYKTSIRSVEFFYYIIGSLIVSAPFEKKLFETAKSVKKLFNAFDNIEIVRFQIQSTSQRWLFKNSNLN